MQFHKIKSKLKRTKIYNIHQFLKYKTYPLKLKLARINATKPCEKAITEELFDGKQVIISLTSFPARMHILHKCLYSLMHQSYKPNKIVLWLSEEQFPERDKNIPYEVRELQVYGLEIKWVEGDIRSYKKLIPALKKFPNDIIVTVDDDLYYPEYWLKCLVEAYRMAPNCIHCHLITRLEVKNGFIHDVKRTVSMRDSCSYSNKILGGSGTLYPPKSLNSKVFDEATFMSIAPTSDDIWFWAMAIINGKKIHWIKKGMGKLYNVECSQENTPCLTSVNDQGEKLFLKHLNEIADRFELKGLLNI